MLYLLFTFISPFSIALLLPPSSLEGLRQPLHLREHRQPRHCPQHHCSFRYETCQNCLGMMCKRGQTLEFVEGVGWLWGAMPPVLGKEAGCQMKLLMGLHLSYAFYGNWPSRLRRSYLALYSYECKIKSGHFLCIWRCVELYVLHFLYNFFQTEYLPPSLFPSFSFSSQTQKFYN